ncbi:MAG: hypothetical protein WC655_15390 [Candidatus Hydrogenedentales bacterium]
MKKFAAILAVLVMAIVIGACTPAPVAPPVTPSTPPTEEVKAEPPAPAQLPDSAMPAEPAAEMPASTPAANNLPSTTWTVLYEGSEYTVTFNSETEVTIKGGEADAQAPDGLQGTYKVADGALTVDIPSVGLTLTGEYDGTVLKLNGNEAKKVETPAAAPADAAAPAADPAAPAAAPADAAAPAAAPAAATNFDDFNYEKGGGSASARR